jgi:hypothetical protein
MKSKGRPQGSKDTKQRKRFPRLRLSRERLEEIRELSVQTGISEAKVLDDAVAEGIACLRSDGYESLLKFQRRRGKVVHERDLEGDGETSERPAPEESRESVDKKVRVHDPVAQDKLEDRLDDAPLGPGFGTEDNADIGTGNKRDADSVGRELVKQVTSHLEPDLTAPGELPVTDLPI